MRKTYFNKISEAVNEWMDCIEKNIPENCRHNVDKFSALMRSKIITEVKNHKKLSDAEMEEGIKACLIELFILYHYIKSGKQDYELTDGLAWWLANTDNTDVDCKFVQSPFQTICVMIPEGIFEVSGVHGEASLGSFVNSVYVLTFPLENCTMISMLIITNDSEKFCFGYTFRHGFSVKDEIERHVKEFNHARFDGKFFSFVLNILLYCTSAEPDESWHPQLQALWSRHKAEKKPKRKARLLSEIEKIGKRRILGRKIIISREDREDFKEAFRTGNKKIGKRFMVAGHWRNQPYGAKHALRKKLFIQPYWKGPEDAEELLNRIRQVGKKKSLVTMLVESEEMPIVGSVE